MGLFGWQGRKAHAVRPAVALVQRVPYACRTSGPLAVRFIPQPAGTRLAYRRLE